MSICGIHIQSRVDGVNRSVVGGGGGWDDNAAASSRDKGLSATNIFSKIRVHVWMILQTRISSQT